MESEIVIDFHQLIHCILFEDYKLIQCGAGLESAVKTVDYMLLVNFFHEQHIEHFQLTNKH